MVEVSADFAAKLMDELIGDIAEMLGCAQDSDDIICAIAQMKESITERTAERDAARAMGRREGWGEGLLLAAQIIEDDNTAGYGQHNNMAIASKVSAHHVAAIRAALPPLPTTEGV